VTATTTDRAVSYASPALLATLAGSLEAGGPDGVAPVIQALVHELRQPLAAVALIGDLLLQRDDVSVEVAEWVHLMVDQGQAMSGLCRELATAVEEAS
jgi:signal transduction histidine kinase